MIRGTTRWGPSLGQRMRSFYREGRFKRWLKGRPGLWICRRATWARTPLDLGVRQLFGQHMGKAPLWRGGAGGPRTLSRRTCGTQGKQHRTSPKRWPRWTWPLRKSEARFAPGRISRKPSPYLGPRRVSRPDNFGGEGACKGKQKCTVITNMVIWLEPFTQSRAKSLLLPTVPSELETWMFREPCIGFLTV